MLPNEATALHVLAYVLLHNAQPDRAVSILEALDALRPDDTRTLLALAAAQLQSGAAYRAIQTLERIAWTHDAPAAIDLLTAQAMSLVGRHDQALKSMQMFLAKRARTPAVTASTE